MNKKERIEGLMKKNNIDGYSTLLARIGAKLGEKDLTKFIEKNKGNFSKMVKGERNFIIDYVVPLEEVLNASFCYIEKGEEMNFNIPNSKIRLEDVARSNKYEEFKKLETTIDKNNDTIIANLDEYGMGIMDYIIKHDSIEGIRYLIKEHNMQFCYLNNTCATNGDLHLLYFNEDSLNIVKLICENDEVELFEELFKTDVIWDYIDKERCIYTNEEFLKAVLSTEKIFNKILDYKKMKLNKVNAGLMDDKSEGYFINPLINLLLNCALTNSELYEDKIMKILNKGIGYNNVAIHEVEKQNPKYLKDLKIDEEGYLLLSRTRYGSLIYCGDSLLVNVSDEIKEKVKELNNINKELLELIKKNWDGSSVINYLNKGEYTYKKHSSNEYEYQMYKLMNKNNFSYIPVYLGEEENLDKFAKFEGEIVKTRFSQSYDKVLEIVDFLKKYHKICMKNLNGKVYVHGYLNSHNLVYENDLLKLVVGWENCKIGEYYEDVVKLIWRTCNIDNFNCWDKEFVFKTMQVILNEYEANEEFRTTFANKLRCVMEEEMKALNKKADNYEIMYMEIKRGLAFVDLYEEKLNSL